MSAHTVVTIPARNEADGRECKYRALLDKIVALIDPNPSDPWPRHDEASGASLAVTVAAWRRAGGIPAVPLGEDRAFVAALRRIDARLKHAPEVRVTVSGRIEDHAAGGMADTMRRRMLASDLMLDDRLEAASAVARWAFLRRAARAVHAGGGDAVALAGALALPNAAPLGIGAIRRRMGNGRDGKSRTAAAEGAGGGVVDLDGSRPCPSGCSTRP